jgi:hypothetical protein
MTEQSARAVSLWAIRISFMFLASTACRADPPVLPTAPAAPESSASAAPAPPTRRDRRLTVQERIEQRVRLMAEALDLSADQQRQLQTILMEQLRQAQRIARDPAIAPEDRIGALRALNQRTRERIRGMLDETQKKKYGLPASEAEAPDFGKDGTDSNEVPR